MKYYGMPKNRKRGKRVLLYLTAVGCAAAIGAAAYMTAVRSSLKTELPSSPDTQQAEPEIAEPEINIPDISLPSYPDAGSEQAEAPAEDIPYEEPQQAMIMPVDGEVIKDFSDTALQFSATYNDLRLHTGIDIACEKKTAVRAAGSGRVAAVEQSSGLGGFVTVEHDNGVVFKYCGLDNITVAVGQRLEMGDTVGVIGDIPGECAEKSHLHLEASSSGAAVSPLEYIGVLD